MLRRTRKQSVVVCRQLIFKNRTYQSDCWVTSLYLPNVQSMLLLKKNNEGENQRRREMNLVVAINYKEDKQYILPFIQSSTWTICTGNTRNTRCLSRFGLTLTSRTSNARSLSFCCLVLPRQTITALDFVRSSGTT